MRLALAPLGLALTMAVQAAPVKCYDWIQRDRIRGGYLSAADLGEGMARMKTVGMNLVMPKFGGLQGNMFESDGHIYRPYRLAAFHNIFAVAARYYNRRCLFKNLRLVSCLGNLMSFFFVRYNDKPPVLRIFCRRRKPRSLKNLI